MFCYAKPKKKKCGLVDWSASSQVLTYLAHRLSEANQKVCKLTVKKMSSPNLCELQSNGPTCKSRPTQPYLHNNKFFIE